MFNTADGGFLLQSLLLSKSLDQLKRLSLVSRVFSVTPVNRVNNIQLALSASIIRMPSYIFMFSEPHISSPSGFGENFTRTHKIHNRKHVDAGFIHACIRKYHCEGGARSTSHTTQLFCSAGYIYNICSLICLVTQIPFLSTLTGGTYSFAKAALFYPPPLS